MTDEEFFALCQSNETVLFEREPNGEIIERPLAGWQTSQCSAKINCQLGNWSRRDGSGVCFGALTGFALPDGAIRGVYAAWVPIQNFQDSCWIYAKFGNRSHSIQENVLF